MNKKATHGHRLHLLMHPEQTGKQLEHEPTSKET